VPYLTNETLFENMQRPSHLIVIGGGPIGVEMAQAHRRLGAAVTIVEQATLLPKDDPELVDVVRAQLQREGVTILEGGSLKKVDKTPAGIAATVDRGGKPVVVAGSHLLLAVGRKANVETLNLEAAGVQLGPRGIETSAQLKTSNRKIYAIGDVNGRFPFTHAAGYHAGIVLRNALFRLPAKVDDRAMPWVTYTDPELAQVGLTEAAARERHGQVTALRWPFHDNDRAQAERRTDGFAKVVLDKAGRILGASIVGANAGEVVQPWCLAIANGMKIGAMAGLVAPYPTLGEINKRVAGSYFTPKLFNERTRKIVRFLLRLG
jgi:pyruvate/2-oxoglutarate dehydrogenase complex dihydrolipoamide dehydrogenase (E3) component